MKKIISAIIALMMFSVVMLTTVGAENEISVYLDGAKVEFDVKPQVIDGRTMLPIRAIFEKLGAVVEWEDNNKSAVCVKDGIEVKMTVGSPEIYVNDKVVQMDISPVIIDDRTLAPVRYAAEAFGSEVQWSEKNSAVVICSKDVYAYADYPDIPDYGRCYNTVCASQTREEGNIVLSYICKDINDNDHCRYLYNNSSEKLGKYINETVNNNSGVVTSYTKEGEGNVRYFIRTSANENDDKVVDVIIPDEMTNENTVTLYAIDGRTITVYKSEVDAYLNVGWCRSLEETQQTLYAPDGRTITVYKSEVDAYLNAGWYRSLEETQQTLYAPDGRTITVYKDEVPSYKNVGWYESYSEAQSVNKPATTVKSNSQTSYNPSADGYYYRTPSGKKYHLDPNCGGKNSYRTTNISGLSPCAKCAK